MFSIFLWNVFIEMALIKLKLQGLPILISNLKFKPNYVKERKEIMLNYGVLHPVLRCNEFG